MNEENSYERIIKLFGDGQAVDNQGLVYFVYECPFLTSPQYAGTYIKGVYFNRASCASLSFQEVLSDYKENETEAWWKEIHSYT